MSHWEVEIESPIELADWLSWLIADQLNVAVEIQDEETLTRGPQEDLCRLIVRLEDQPNEQWIKSLKACLGEVGAPNSPIRTRCDDNDDWKLGWRAFFSTVHIAPGVVARPPWSDAVEGINIIIDPGLAFGTGTHGTTRLAAQLSYEILHTHPKSKVLDQGSGSGILAMMAAYLGHDVIGIEVDPVAVKNAQENLNLNSITTSIQFACSDEVPKKGAEFSVVIANIIAPILIDLAHDIKSVCKDYIILSGMQNHQVDEVLQAYQGWDVIQTISEDQWVACVLQPHQS